MGEVDEAVDSAELITQVGAGRGHRALPQVDPADIEVGVRTQSTGDSSDVHVVEGLAGDAALGFIRERASWAGADQAGGAERGGPGRAAVQAAEDAAVRDVAVDGPKSGLVVRPVGYLFGQNVARVAFKRGAYLRNFVYTFAELLSERLTRALILRAMAGNAAGEPSDPAL